MGARENKVGKYLGHVRMFLFFCFLLWWRTIRRLSVYIRVKSEMYNLCSPSIVGMLSLRMREVPGSNPALIAK